MSRKSYSLGVYLLLIRFVRLAVDDFREDKFGNEFVADKKLKTLKLFDMDDEASVVAPEFESVKRRSAKSSRN